MRLLSTTCSRTGREALKSSTNGLGRKTSKSSTLVHAFEQGRKLTSPGARPMKSFRQRLRRRKRYPQTKHLKRKRKSMPISPISNSRLPKQAISCEMWLLPFRKYCHRGSCPRQLLMRTIVLPGQARALRPCARRSPGSCGTSFVISC